MNHLDCPKLTECHDQLKNDIQLIECIRYSLDHGHLEQAKDEIDIYMRRLQHRNLDLTGREL
ncbi:hypothetical protein CCP3SC15_150008 [Gammaproteobacteria bacterium]